MATRIRIDVVTDENGNGETTTEDILTGSVVEIAYVRSEKSDDLPADFNLKIETTTTKRVLWEEDDLAAENRAQGFIRELADHQGAKRPEGNFPYIAADTVTATITDGGQYKRGTFYLTVN